MFERAHPRPKGVPSKTKKKEQLVFIFEEPSPAVGLPFLKSPPSHLAAPVASAWVGTYTYTYSTNALSDTWFFLYD